MKGVPEWLRRLAPPGLRRIARHCLRHRIYRGDYASWPEARRASRGYDDAAIANKVIAATRAVRDGRALWERDTVLFHTPEVNKPLVCALRRAASLNGGGLNVADFGGALGSTWWQHRNVLSSFEVRRWSVIEQPALVAAGRREFTIDPLRFYSTLDEVRKTEAPSVLLLSSVLPYLEDPHALLGEIREGGFRHLIIDRTGFVARARDRLTVQHVPPEIYSASYPCWFFNRAGVLTDLGESWRVVDEWTTNDAVDIDAEYRGMLFERADAGSC